MGLNLVLQLVLPARLLTTAGVSNVVHDAAQHAELGIIHAYLLRLVTAAEISRSDTSLTEAYLVLRQRRALAIRCSGC
jgi:hypothetical protein